MRVRQFGKWNTAKAKVVAPLAKSEQVVAVELGGLIVEMKEDEALALVNELADFLEPVDAAS